MNRFVTIAETARRCLPPSHELCARKTAIESSVDQRLAVAVVALENLARGSFTRRIEILVARLLGRIGKETRAMTMSVGIGQVQVRHFIRHGETIGAALTRGSRDDDGVSICIGHIGAIVDGLGLDPDSRSWTRDMWMDFGRKYHGAEWYGGCARWITVTMR